MWCKHAHHEHTHEICRNGIIFRNPIKTTIRLQRTHTCDTSPPARASLSIALGCFDELDGRRIPFGGQCSQYSIVSCDIFCYAATKNCLTVCSPADCDIAHRTTHVHIDGTLTMKTSACMCCAIVITSLTRHDNRLRNTRRTNAHAHTEYHQNIGHILKPVHTLNRTIPANQTYTHVSPKKNTQICGLRSTC